MDHVFGLGPRLEHERAGRIEDALDSEFALGHFSSSIFSHLYFLLAGVTPALSGLFSPPLSAKARGTRGGFS
jgi:hypothetical protein